VDDGIIEYAAGEVASDGMSSDAYLPFFTAHIIEPFELEAA
jgi:hypothetical protein